MNGAELLRVVDTIQREKNIPKETIFNGIEEALRQSVERTSEEVEDVIVYIDRNSGNIVAQCGDQMIEPERLGRIAAQAAKQVMIQKIREAESEGVFSEFGNRKGEMVIGTVQRVDKGTAIVNIAKDTKGQGSVEAILPRSEQIPGETLQVNDRVKAVVMEVRRSGNRVKIVLSRNHPDFVKALFEQEIPEINDRTIEIKSVAREPGQRSKVGVSSIDLKVDCVGACVGVRGSRIKTIIDELNGERIDIVRWNDSLQILIPNSLAPAEISDVMLYHRLGRAIVLVTDDNLSLAIGRRGQNVRLASKLTKWDIEIMTVEELTDSVEKAERWFAAVPNAPDNFAETVITEGFLTYEDLTDNLDAETLGEILGITPEDADDLLEYCEDHAQEMEDEPPAEKTVEAPVAVVDGGGEVAQGAETNAEPAPVGGLDALFGDDTPSEEAVVEEAVVEETVAEEAPVEATPAEVAEAPQGETPA